ncbi:MAG: NAD-dependent epimerase/dehydratase family protein [Chloroflexi bacterium]|jgi:threonine 3-dehydrogenase|nr:NAD-dependent epimerase/dehydratase family protein [Chloroflexota bacterium]MBT3669214.1 NAD-dependent epimerase/dehydratase family protein [Chloroflexota bacterium]MBT4004090.1 NAD-dependent epimerase/dehydratase family protein [Chloroflexota bacterium]MBT4306459.1 NAD-dependent epimerase/dehydratase family protein [Chloroflexota bacterium]MBT4534958.1 NAD-dependent epimerase/dehydratase family protein [Chloroflexota bacterium]
MRKKVILITGACGEIGHALVDYLIENSDLPVVTLDLQDASPEIVDKVIHVKGSVTDKSLFDRLISEYEIDIIYHLAALLSTSAEFNPVAAHNVNVEGTLMLLEMAASQTEFRGKPVKFIFPSSIAAYGMPDLETKTQFPNVKEWEWNYPTTMYGANKLYCEMLGIYFSDHFKQLAEIRPVTLDFRAIRFPGLISAFTLPSGGTTDYGPEMLHAAAKGETYNCFVREDSAIPFMAMPDAVKSLTLLAEAPDEKIKKRVYNISAFSLLASEFREEVLKYFPEAKIGYQIHPQRQKIIDSWPIGCDDTAAQEDWGWSADYGLERCFEEYLVPNIKKRYE